MQSTSRTRLNRLIWSLPLIGLAIGMVILLITIRDHGTYVDEGSHGAQILFFRKGLYYFQPSLTMLPGYHAIVGGIAALLNANSLKSARQISFLLGLSVPLSVWLLAGKMGSRPRRRRRVFRVILLPILFPFFFLLYTDVLSLASVLLSYYFLEKKEYDRAGALGLLAFLVRQNNIIWVFFLHLMGYLDKHGFKFDLTAMRKYLTASWTFSATYLLCLEFLYFNGGAVLGDRGAHPLSIHLENFYFMLFLSFLLFLPYHISNLGRVGTFLKQHVVVSVALSVIGFVTFVFLTSFHHPYNFDSYHLRNIALNLFRQPWYYKSLLFIPLLFSLFSHITYPRHRPILLLSLATFAYVSMSWLVEQRYYLIPFSFFLILKREDTDFVENTTIVVFGLMSLILFYCIHERIYFL